MSTPYPPTPPDDGGGAPDHGGQPNVGYPDPYGYPPQAYGQQTPPYGQQLQPDGRQEQFYGQPAQQFGTPFAPEQPPVGVNGLAIASLVAAFLFPPLAIIFGHLALSQIESRNEGGRGLAVAGLVLGYLFTVLTIIGVIIAIVFLVVLARSFDDYRMRTMSDERPIAAEFFSDAAGPTLLVHIGSTDRTWAGSVVHLAM